MTITGLLVLMQRYSLPLSPKAEVCDCSHCDRILLRLGANSCREGWTTGFVVAVACLAMSPWKAREQKGTEISGTFPLYSLGKGGQERCPKSLVISRTMRKDYYHKVTATYSCILLQDYFPKSILQNFKTKQNEKQKWKWKGRRKGEMEK